MNRHSLQAGRYHLCIYLLMAILVLNGYRSLGQDVDITSLKSQVENARTKSEQFEARRNLANYYRNNGDIERYGIVSKELLQIAYTLDDDSKLVTAYGNLGNYFANKSDFHSTLTYYLKALPIAEKLNDANKVLRLYNN